MTGSVSAYNQIQKIPESAATGTMTDTSVVYTCPTGKKAKITISYVLVALGAHATTFIVVAAVQMFPMVAANVNLVQENTFQLNAGETFRGYDNATINYTYNVLELPA